MISASFWLLGILVVTVAAERIFAFYHILSIIKSFSLKATYAQLSAIEPSEMESLIENFDLKIYSERKEFSQSAKRHLQDVLKMSYQDKQDILPRHLADVQKMS